MRKVMSEEKRWRTSIACSIGPWLSVRNGARAIEFYKAAFGAVEVHHVENPAGEVVSRLKVEQAEFWLSDDDKCSPQTLGECSARMILTVPDPDAMFARALVAGAKQVFEVSEGHGWRVGRLVDPFGHHWEIGRPLE
jgi:PhnB protein